jgi:hypothetical protein
LIIDHDVVIAALLASNISPESGKIRPFPIIVVSKASYFSLSEREVRLPAESQALDEACIDPALRPPLDARIVCANRG